MVRIIEPGRIFFILIKIKRVFAVQNMSASKGCNFWKFVENKGVQWFCKVINLLSADQSLLFTVENVKIFAWF